MKKYTKITALFLAFMLMFTVAGCTSGTDESSPSPSTADGDGKAGTRTITDMLGREVEIPETIENVVAIGATARMLTYAGCADKIVGITDLEKECSPGMPYAYINSDSFSKLTGVAPGGVSGEIYDEALATLAPDIIFTSFIEIDQVNTMQAKLNIPVVALSYQGIFSDSVYDALTLVGDIMGAQDRCTELIAAMKGWQKDLNDRTKDIADADKPSVYAGAVSFRGGHGIEGTYANYPPFTAINAKNVVDEAGKDGALLIEKEKLVVWDPDIIFLTPGNMGLVNEDYKTNSSYYTNLKAVKNGNVYSQIDYNYYGTNIELSIADAYYAGAIVYPKAFSDIDFEKKADEIFKEMLGKPYMQVLKDNGNGFGKITIGE
ncbi:MAG: iron ABC transporter substrate-binding protein [Clostridiales bacterium]|nr:iron ABC transporter substrate-binding protein [Clostridiales bacterium]